MNGQNSRKVVTQGLVQPTGMAIDFANYDSVFWVDQKLNILQGMLADGSKVKTLARGGKTVTLLSQSLLCHYLHDQPFPLNVGAMDFYNVSLSHIKKYFLEYGYTLSIIIVCVGGGGGRQGACAFT